MLINTLPFILAGLLLIHKIRDANRQAGMKSGEEDSNPPPPLSTSKPIAHKNTLAA
jgi:hypothetical protein